MRILVFGAMGVGDTTLGKEVALRLSVPHIDLDDHHWRWDTPIPYTIFRTKEERTQSLLRAIAKAPSFVMSGSMWSLRKTFDPYFDLAVFLSASPETCAERLRRREQARWGERVLPGGDMYASSAMHSDYLLFARRYETDISPQMCRPQHEQWIRELPCPTLRLDGEKPIAENALLVLKAVESRNPVSPLP